MTIIRSTLALAAAALLAGGAWAQDAPAEQDPAPETPAQEAPSPDDTAIPPQTEIQGDAISAEGLSLGEEPAGDGMGQTYVAETFQDWEIRCVRMPDGSDPCQMYQLLQDEEGNSVAEISMFGLPDGGQAAAGATIITPLETLLTEQITLQVDNGQAKRYPFTWCAAIGCVARVGFTGAEVEAFRRGARATITIVPAAAPDQQVNLDLSLMGFSAAYGAVREANAGQQTTAD